MPSDKRQRQRAGREARRAAARAAQRRAQRRRQIIAVVALIAVIFGIGLVLNLGGDDEETDVAAGDATTTTFKTSGSVPCPPEDPAAEVERRTSFPEAPQYCLDKGEDYKATVETDVGSFELDLLEKKAPATVNNFVWLARYKAYNDVPFHRVIPDFVVQGGDVEKGDGTGGPGYQFADELPKPSDYAEGSVAMANSGPGTNGSQFFVVTSEKGAETLVQAVGGKANYSLFAKVTSGMDVVKKIEADGSPGGTPTVVHKIVSVTISTD